MNKKRQILAVIDRFGSLNFSSLYQNLETGQSKKALSVYLNSLKADHVIEQHHQTKHYSLTSLGEQYIDGRAPQDKPLRDEPEPPATATSKPTTQLIDEFKKLHGQLGRVIKSMEDSLCPK